jgi:hypothetical protein
VLENKTKTSTGFLINTAEAERYAAQILHPQAAEKVARVVKNVAALAALGRELHAAVQVDPSQPDFFRGD